jgi:hypothetical protein
MRIINCSLIRMEIAYGVTEIGIILDYKQLKE